MKDNTKKEIAAVILCGILTGGYLLGTCAVADYIDNIGMDEAKEQFNAQCENEGDADSYYCDVYSETDLNE